MFVLYMLKKYVFVVKVYHHFLLSLYIKCPEECSDNVLKVCDSTQEYDK